MFALVDCNNFYASCERVFQPQLNGRPVAILSNNDGCVIARSDEAKEVGVPMGAPYFKFKKMMEENKVAVFSSNYPLYGDMSARVANTLASIAPEIEIYSIDESFLKYEHCDYVDFKEEAERIRDAVKANTGIPVSVGFAPTKALSKVANRIAKKGKKKTNNVFVIDSEEKRKKALKWIEIGDVWGIGRGHVKRLKAINVNTGYDFTQLPDEWVRKNMSIVGLRLKRDLHGIPTLDLDEQVTKRNIATTRSFERDYTDYEDVKERISTFAISCAEKLRKQNSSCAAIMVFIRSNRHKKELSQYHNSFVMQLPYPTNSSMELNKFAIKALDQIFVSGYHYKKAGVMVMELTNENEQQLSLFDERNPKHDSLMKVMDKLNGQSSNHLIKLASQDLKRTWKMNQNYLSPRYTTRLNEIIKVKA